GLRRLILGRRSLLGLAGRLEHVLLADPAADTGALEGGQVHAVLSGELADQRGHVGADVATPGRLAGGLGAHALGGLGLLRLGGRVLGLAALGGLLSALLLDLGLLGQLAAGVRGGLVLLGLCRLLLLGRLLGGLLVLRRRLLGG